MRHRTLTTLPVPTLFLSLACTAVAQETDAEKLAAALAAAPPEVSADALVLDWPAEPGADFRVLREGDNGWTCLPDMPGDANYEPMCNDEEWMRWIRSFMSGAEPENRALGVSYMLNSRWATSNVDPAAVEATADNMWIEGGGHLMMIVPDAAMLDHLPDEPGPGAYVMWKGTPWVHIMIPMEELVGPPR